MHHVYVQPQRSPEKKQKGQSTDPFTPAQLARDAKQGPRNSDDPHQDLRNLAPEDPRLIFLDSKKKQICKPKTKQKRAKLTDFSLNKQEMCKSETLERVDK